MVKEINVYPTFRVQTHTTLIYKDRKNAGMGQAGEDRQGIKAAGPQRRGDDLD